MKRFIGGLLLFIIFTGNSCSTGSDPEPVILDVFLIPAKVALQIENICNDIAMDVNAFAMHNLSAGSGAIANNGATCLDGVVYRDQSTSDLDSIVLNYGTSSCSSNGGIFTGKIIVEPRDASLKLFQVLFKDFSSQAYTITGLMNFQITGTEGGDDFTIDMSDVSFSLTGTDNNIYSFNVTSLKNSYDLIDVGQKKTEYIDDVFKFTTSFSGLTPSGNSFDMESTSAFTYAYSCNNIIGGKADLSVSDIGEAKVDFGEGDLQDDCEDGDVLITTEGFNFTVTL